MVSYRKQPWKDSQGCPSHHSQTTFSKYLANQRTWFLVDPANNEDKPNALKPSPAHLTLPERNLHSKTQVQHKTSRTFQIAHRGAVSIELPFFLNLHNCQVSQDPRNPLSTTFFLAIATLNPPSIPCSATWIKIQSKPSKKELTFGSASSGCHREEGEDFTSRFWGNVCSGTYEMVMVAMPDEGCIEL